MFSRVRTAELEHENDIPHIDEEVQKSCRTCNPEETKIESIIRLGMMTPNEARDLKQKFKDMEDRGQEPTIMYADGMAINVLPTRPGLRPDLDIVEEEYK